MSFTSVDPVKPQQRFRLWNVTTDDYCDDLSALKNCKFAYLAEYHHLAANAAQKTILQLFPIQKTCLLIEGLAPGIKIDMKAMHFFSDWPDHFEVRGYDVRGIGNADEHVIHRNIDWNLALARQTLIQAATLKVKEMASFLNTLYEQGTLIIDGDHIRLEESSFDCLEHYWNVENNIQPFKDEVFQLEKELDAYRTRSDPGRVQESNVVLVQEMVKTSEEFDLVIAILGISHLTKDLALTGHDFVVLVPSAPFEQECLKEISHINCEIPMIRMCLTRGLEIPGKTEAFVVPKEQILNFHPAIQNVLKNSNLL